MVRPVSGAAEPRRRCLAVKIFLDAGLPSPGPAASSWPQQLTAAKSVSWRGQGDLLQLAWAKPLTGSWLVLDLWAGVSGLCLALLCAGTRFFALAAERDFVPAEVVSATLPNVVQLDSVEEVTGEGLRPFLQRRNVRGIIVGGGSPCQGNSALNPHRQGLQDPRSCQPRELLRSRDEIAALPEAQHLELVVWLENVASMPASVKAQYTAWLGADPILMDAAPCGWVQRRRLLWLTVNGVGVSPQCAPPDGWDWILHSQSEPELRYQGQKPIPPKVHFEDNFQPLFDAGEVVRQSGQGAMHPFTREFWHPADRTHLTSPDATARFYADDRRFPPSAYSAESLLWRGDSWRQPSPMERCQMMGLPAQCLRSVTGPTAVRRQRQNSLLGNGFHVPMIVALFCLVPQLLAHKVPAPLLDLREHNLRQRLTGTIWEPGRLQVFPGLRDAPAVLHDMKHHLLADFFVPDPVWQHTEKRLQGVPLWQLQAFTGWALGHGLGFDDLGSTVLSSSHRTELYAGISGQRYPGTSAKGLDHLLPPGLGKEAHIAQALPLPSPFRPRPWPEPDVDFVLHAVTVWQEALIPYAASCRKILAQLGSALARLEDALEVYRSPSSRQVASSKRPGLMAFLTSLLRWPDWQQPRHLLQGYPIVGELEPSGIFRSITAREGLPLQEWLGPPAEAAIYRIERSPPPRFAERILEATKQEQDKGYCSPFFTKADLDKKFGRGCWRPLERFLLQQHNKDRVIDNARKTLHNCSTSMWETILTISLDFVPAVVRQLCQRMQVTTPQQWHAECPWLDFRLGTEDLPDAYRGLPVCDRHLPFSVVAVYIPEQGWRYTILYGLAFGLESAVVSFNRLPMFGVSVARRCLYALCACYFDDELAVECIAGSNISQRGLVASFRLLGAPPQTSKSFSPAADRHYLGASVHLGSVLHDGTVRLQPKFATVAKVTARLQDVLQAGVFQRDEVGKLRGDLNWLFTQASGHLGRLAQPLLARHQATPGVAFSDAERLTLRLLAQIVKNYQPRDITVCGPVRPPLLIYSDASFEAGELRLGWVIFDPGLFSQPCGGTTVVPSEVINSWIPRSQQIFPGETLCALVLPHLYAEVLRGRDIVWFGDNEAAVSALVRGSSSQEDVHEIAQFAQFLFSDLCVRVWFEWIDTFSNPADGLSRLGVLDPWTQSQNWILQEFPFPDGLSRGAFLSTLCESGPVLNSG